MKRKTIPPFVMTAGQSGRLLFDFSLPEGAARPVLRGALMVHGERVDMAAGDGELTIPALPAGVYLAEVRAGGVCVLYGHVEVLPSPLYADAGEARYEVAVDARADVLEVNVVLRDGPRGMSAYEIARQEGFEGTEAEWLEYLRVQNATLAVQQVTPLMERAESAATNAADSEAEAGKYAAEAQVKAVEAGIHTTAAAQAAKDAATSASQAQEGASAALSDREAANAFMRQAGLHADSAKASAAGADQKAKAAEASASDAFGSASQAKASETAAATEATNAEASATAAATSASEAATSAEQVVEAAEAINAHDVYWAAWFKRQTDLTEHFRVIKIASFNYALPNLKIGASAFYDSGLTAWTVALPLLENGNRMFAKCRFEEWTVDLPKLQDGSVMFAWAKFPIWTVDLPSLTQGYVMFEDKPMTEFHGNLDKLQSAQGMFTKCPALSIFDSALTALSDAPEMFNMCILTKESALNVLTTLPTYTSGTHRITVGIHIDHQGDADIAEAVAEAEGKGWAVTVQWNGTASAAGATTWGLRGQSIFARVIEREAVDGSMCRVLDWGHYVTDPAGYEEFGSIEDALNEWGLTEVEDLTEEGE